MSILSRLKNKLHDPVYHENKLREFDECMTILKNENTELHKRIDQLEALCKTNLSSSGQSPNILQEQIEQLEQENHRLFNENQYQREEYERFLDQLTTMVVRTAVMQENIRQECASIYHVIERLANVRAHTIEMKFPFDVIKQAKRRILNTSNRIPNQSSSSSSSSLTTHGSISTSDSWTIDLKPEKSPNLQRSETFIVAKQSPVLASPCTNIKPQSSTPKVSRVPIRIGSFLHRQINSTKKPIPPTIITRSSPVNTISSESSNGEQQQHMDTLLPIVQDEGYSTWSSIDVKDDAIKNDDRVQNWIDLTNQPVNKVENNQLDEQLFNNNSSTICSKDISLDSLDDCRSLSSSSSASSSSTFENLLLKQTLTNLTDSTSSTTSTFNMSEYIEDHFIEHDEHLSENSSSHETTILSRTLPLKPQKRLLFPGLLNRLIFYRRILSDSDLRRTEFFIDDNENHPHVYHANIINEHSVEVNLINTYGSDSELHVWSHDCAEQRRFLDERRQQQISNHIFEHQSNNSNQQLEIEKQSLLQQIFEYPWLLQENDLDHTNMTTPNPEFYQLCTVTNSGSLSMANDSNIRRTTSPTTKPSPVI